MNLLNVCPEILSKISNRIGLSSITLSVGTTTAQAADVAPQVLAEPLILGMSAASIALSISAIGGVLFIIEKIITIYSRCKSLKHQAPGTRHQAKRTKNRRTNTK